MSFTLNPSTRVDRTLRRLARKELRDARRELDNSHRVTAESVHEARKRVKKVRAILRMIESDAGQGLDGSRKGLRRVAHQLSRVRDADSMVEIVDKLQQKQPRPFDEQSLRLLRRWIADRRKRIRQKAIHDKAWASAAKELRSIRRGAKRWRPSHQSFGVLSHGIADTLRRGRKALQRATKRRRADDFHNWRKEMKALRYQLRLLEPASQAIRRDIRALHDAEASLGDDHNIVVLCGALATDGSTVTAPLIRRLRTAADRYHADARKRALAVARRIYSRKPRRYVRELKRAWTRWERQN